MSLWMSLLQTGSLRALDVALAETVQRQDPGASDAVLAGVALASLAVSHGHAALDLARPQLLVESHTAWPSVDAWARALADARCVASPAQLDVESEPKPLVLENGLLYLRRYREYERRLARGLRGIAAHSIDADPAPLAPLFRQLFPSGDADDLQAQAARLALERTLLLVTGGPGTGKTTTIARLLVLRIAQSRNAGRPDPRIALAAPTGRAAERMAANLQRAAAQMAEDGVESTLRAALPESASTLHRLLGVIPDTPRFRYGAEDPLPLDIVVVDEASMVDLPLMCKLVEAVADGAQLILLGDADQLPSVEAGDVLASILGATGDGQELQGARVHLKRSWRQSAALDLAPLAAAVCDGNSASALALLHGGRLSNVRFHADATDPLAACPQLLEHWCALAAFDDPAQALQHVGAMCLLTALRDGPQGATTLNARIETLLSGQPAGRSSAWFRGRLLLIARNSPEHGLSNGDVGICLPDAQGQPRVWFAASGGMRAFHPAALPAHESAFAMTVHKAQGSEFDTVFLQLPGRDARVLSRELLYTGITRARNSLHLAASEDVLTTALARRAQRVSGLTARLQVAGVRKPYPATVCPVSDAG